MTEIEYAYTLLSEAYAKYLLKGNPTNREIILEGNRLRAYFNARAAGRKPKPRKL